jgi:hypothetical protein
LGLVRVTDRIKAKLVACQGQRERATKRDEKGDLMSKLLPTGTNVVNYKARPELSPP